MLGENQKARTLSKSLRSSWFGVQSNKIQPSFCESLLRCMNIGLPYFFYQINSVNDRLNYWTHFRCLRLDKSASKSKKRQIISFSTINQLLWLLGTMRHVPPHYTQILSIVLQISKSLYNHYIHKLDEMYFSYINNIPGWRLM